MKEKTFEELFHEALDSDEPYGAFTIPTKKQQAILKLLQQVREATIAECVEIIFDKWNNAIPVIRELPNDRIKTEK